MRRDREPTAAPPRLARWVLRRALRDSDPATTEGELGELFAQRRSRDGTGAARAWYWRQVLGFVARGSAVRGSTRPDPPERRGGASFGDIGADVRVAIRGLKNRPTFTAVAVLTLALGIGANSAIFTLVTAHFLTSLPYDRPDELVLLWETRVNSPDVTTVSPGNYHSWRDDAGSFEDIAAFNVARATLSGDGVAERVTASVVPPNFFDVLGVVPLLGSGMSEDGADSNGGDVVVLSHGLWVRRYGSDPGLVGSQIRVDGRPHLVLGVLPASFRQPERSLSWQGAQLWLPLDLTRQVDDHGSRYLRAVARLRPSAAVEDAREEMTVIAARLAEAYPDANRGRGTLVFTLDEYLRADARPTLLVLLLAGAAVLLAVCANVANLTLARGQGRRQEFAVRAALGSGRLRLWRQVVVEGLILAMAGSTVGLGALLLARGVLQRVQERFFSGLVDVSINLWVVGLTVGLAALAGLFFAVPAARSASNANLREALVEGGTRAGAGRGAGATRKLLVMSQVALATGLVVIAGLLARSFTTLVNTSPGFDASSTLVFSVTAPSVRYPERSDVEAYLRAVLAELDRVPGVEGVGLVSDMPFTTENRSTRIQLAGVPADVDDPISVEYRVAFPDYFAVLDIEVLAGTVPDDPWTSQSEVPGVVNRRMATTLWPDRDPIGERLTLEWAEPLDVRVTAVVDDVLDDGYAAAPEPLLYLPYFAQPQRGVWAVVKTRGEPSTFVDPVRRAVAAVDADIPAAGLRPLEGMLVETVARPMAASLIGGVFAVIALLVASAGIYGVLSYSVQTRTREFGIRSALGASDADLVQMVLAQSTRLLVIGLVAGMVGAVVTGGFLSGLLFGVRAWDPVSLAGAALVLCTVGTVAAWVPARRALRIDPREALRAD